MFAWDENDLNKEQANAIREDKSVLLVACPGSGKTRTLTYKIALELSRLTSTRHFIIAITYTNNAADEIKERVELLGVDVSQLWIGTIHSFCLEWILRPYSLYLDELKEGFKILNAHESEELFSQLCKPYSNPKVNYYDCNYYATTNGYRLSCLDDRKIPHLQKVLKEYHKILKERKQVDFEQILYYSYKLISQNKVISKVLSKLFPFILIDEYQDTKDIQYHIIASILKANKGKSRTLIVGDPNQSIFDSLGGFPMKKEKLEELVGFKLESYKLSLNYRSSLKIINYFDFFKTYDNSIFPSGKDKDYESIITYNLEVARVDIEKEIARLILFNINDKKISPNEICIAAPQWIHLASLTRSLMVKLPDYSFDGPGMAPFSRDIDNFWYKLSRIILTEPSPNLYVKRLRWSREILNELHHQGLDTLDITNKKFLRICNSITINEEKGLDYLKAFFSKICAILKINLSAFPGLEEHYQSFFASSQARIDRLKKEGNTFIASTESFRKVFKQREGITVSTIHGVKGEEYDTMIGFALLEDYVPHFSDPNKEANAKKLLYVLASRARKNLHLVSEIGRGISNYDPEGKAPTIQLIEYKYKYDVV